MNQPLRSVPLPRVLGIFQSLVKQPSLVENANFLSDSKVAPSPSQLGSGSGDYSEERQSAFPSSPHLAVKGKLDLPLRKPFPSAACLQVVWGWGLGISNSGRGQRSPGVPGTLQSPPLAWLILTGGGLQMRTRVGAGMRPGSKGSSARQSPERAIWFHSTAHLKLPPLIPTASCCLDSFARGQPPPTMSPGLLRNSHTWVFRAHTRQ